MYFSLLTLVTAFELSIAQNFASTQTAGGSITFNLYNPNGGTVPATTESYDVTLLDGSGNQNDAKTVAKLASGLTQTSGITVTLPGDLSSGSYFLGLVASSETKYSGAFTVTGSTAASASPSPGTTPTPGASSVDSSGNTKASTSSSTMITSGLLVFVGMAAY